MVCKTLSTPEERIAELTRRLKLFTEFALAHVEWEAAVLCDDGPWFDHMPEEFMQGFERVQGLRNIAMDGGTAS